MNVYSTVGEREFTEGSLAKFSQERGPRFREPKGTRELISSFHYAVAQRLTVGKKPGAGAPPIGRDGDYKWDAPRQVDALKAVGLESCTGLFFLYPRFALFEGGGQYTHVVGFHTSGGTIEDFMDPSQTKWPFNAYGIPESSIIAIYAISDRGEDDPWNTTLSRHYKAEVGKLITSGLREKNIYVYNGCADHFTVDINGDLGE